MAKVRFVTLIEIETPTGTGTDKDPARHVYEYYDLTGELVLRMDGFTRETCFHYIPNDGHVVHGKR